MFSASVVYGAFNTMVSEVLNAIAEQQLTIVKTNIVVNCSVIATASGTLPNTVVAYR